MAVAQSSREEFSQDTAPGARSANTLATNDALSVDDKSTNGKELRKRLISGGIWAAIGRGCGILALLGINVLLARCLEPVAFGAYVLIASVVPALSLLAMAGLNRAALRLVSEGLAVDDRPRVRSGLGRTVRLAILTVSITSLSVGVGCALFGNLWLPIPVNATLCILVGLLVLLVATQQLLAETLRGFHEMRVSNLLAGQNGGPLANLGFLVLLTLPALAWPAISLPTVLLLNAIALILVMPLAAWNIRQQHRKHLQCEDDKTTSEEYPYRQLLHVGVPAMGVQLLAFLTSQCDIWIAASAFSGEELAMFGAARRILMLMGIALLLTNRAVVSSIPDLYARGRRKELQRMLQGAASLVAVPTMLGLAVLLVFPADVLGLLFGAYYREAATVLMILSAGQLVHVWTGSCGLTLSLTGHDRISLVINLIAAGLLFGLGPWIATQHGAIGLACLSSVVVATRNLVLWLLARYLVGVWTNVPPRFWRSLPTILNREAARS